MTDSCRTAVLVAVAGGYFLGRTKKAKLALTLGSVLAGRRLGLDPQELVNKGIQKLTETPQFEHLADQVKDELSTALRTAVSSVSNRGIESLTGSLRDRTGRLGASGQAQDEPEEDGTGEEDETGGEAESGQKHSGEKPAETSGGGSRQKPAGRSSSGGKTASSSARPSSGKRSSTSTRSSSNTRSSSRSGTSSTGKKTAGSSGRGGTRHG